MIRFALSCDPESGWRRVTALALGMLVAQSGCDRHAYEGAPTLLAEAATSRLQDDKREPTSNGPAIGAIKLAAPIYANASKKSPRMGYLRAGGTIIRGEQPETLFGCEGGFYRVMPMGYVCADQEASIDLTHPILRALTKRPDLSKPIPYPYAFVRAIAPNYYRVPTRDEQFQYEMSLERHLRSYTKLKSKWDAIKVGANDVPLDASGHAVDEPPEKPPLLSENELFGGNGDDSIPWFFQGGRRIPNIALFQVPDYAVITNRVARKAGLALIGTFMGEDRRFALTTDGRLVPTSKLKPARGSTFHGVDLTRSKLTLPIGFIHDPLATSFELSAGSAAKKGSLEWHSAIQLTGRSREVGGERFVEAQQDGSWIKSSDVAIAIKPTDVPSFAKTTAKWIDVSIQRQTLTLYEFEKPIFATAVATGRDGLGDPKTSFSTVRGMFRIREKHITTTMDSHEVDNKFELRDVPWVQYFEAGYALHAALWHDDFGKPRSHGCINLSPIDARRIFMWTDPPIPVGWHGVYAGKSTGEGTVIYIHP